MKYVLIIADGIADEPVPQLGHRTPLQSLSLPHIDQLAGGMMGTVRTVPEGLPPGSDTAILSIFGHDPRQCYTGRSPLEAAGSGVSLAQGEVSFRVNLCALEGEDFQGAIIRSHNGGNIEGEEALSLMAAVEKDAGCRQAAKALGLALYPTGTFRHVGVMDKAHAPAGGGGFGLTEPHNVLGQAIAPHLPKGTLAQGITAFMAASFKALKDHPVNRERMVRGQLPANCLWPWGAGQAAKLNPFTQTYGKTGVVISAVPLVWGIAALSGLPAPRVPGATGDLDTNYQGKVDCALEALRVGRDLAIIHIEAPDECAHAGDIQGKVEAIHRIDQRVVRPLLAQLPGVDPEFRVMLLSDHPTLLTTRTHDGSPVPFCLYDSRKPPACAKFDEENAKSGPFLPEGTQLMPLLLLCRE